MRRKEKEITDIRQIEDILNQADICRLGLTDNQQPYIVPLNFGYKDNCLYFHCAKEGKKLDIIKKNHHVCFEVEVDTKLVYDEEACKCTMHYKSVIGTGTAKILYEENDKMKALDLIMKHYVDKDTFTYSEKAVQAVVIIKVEINEMTGKKSGY
jgi:hypothetical protein